MMGLTKQCPASPRGCTCKGERLDGAAAGLLRAGAIPTVIATCINASKNFQSDVSLSICTPQIGPPSFQKNPFTCCATCAYHVET